MGCGGSEGADEGGRSSRVEVEKQFSKHQPHEKKEAYRSPRREAEREVLAITTAFQRHTYT